MNRAEANNLPKKTILNQSKQYFTRTLTQWYNQLEQSGKKRSHIELSSTNEQRTQQGFRSSNALVKNRIQPKALNQALGASSPPVLDSIKLQITH